MKLFKKVVVVSLVVFSIGSSAFGACESHTDATAKNLPADATKVEKQDGNSGATSADQSSKKPPAPQE